MKKIMLAAGILIAVIVIAALVLLWTVRPKDTLDLSYERISIASKIREMITARSLDVHLTEADLNNLMKRELAARNPSLPHVQIQGARFEQSGQIIKAFVQAKTVGFVRAEAALTFKLNWQPPNLVVEHLKTEAGPWGVPLGWFHLDPVLVPVEQELPPLVAIKDVKFEASQIVISFKMK